MPAPLPAQNEKPLLSFFVIGDWGRDGHSHQREVANLMAAEVEAMRSWGWTPPAFIVSTGDNFYTFGVSSIHDSKWRTSFIDIYDQPALAGIPWFAVLGNHDYGGDIKAQQTYTGDSRWHMPHPDHGEFPGTFSRHGADFFFLDTVAWIGKEGFPFYFLGDRVRFQDQKRQADWLVSALDRSRSRFRFVFGHHGIYSIGPHGGAMQMKELDDLLRCYNVSAYIHGHDHCLYHITHRGMNYVCSGGGSQIKADYHGAKDKWGCVFGAFCQDGTDTLYPRYDAFLPDAGFARFDLYENRAEFRFRRLHAYGEQGPAWRLAPSGPSCTAHIPQRT